MVVCENCGGNCDHGELVQGICPECQEKEGKRKERYDLLGKLEESGFFQIKLDLEEGNGRINSFGGRIQRTD